MKHRYPKRQCDFCPRWYWPARENQVTCGDKVCVQLNRDRRRKEWEQRGRVKKPVCNKARENSAAALKARLQKEKSMKLAARGGCLRATDWCEEHLHLRYVMVDGKPVNEGRR